MVSLPAYRNHSRSDPFGYTHRVLEDPTNGRTLHLIGTTHASDLLANRTRKLMNTVSPDSLMVQTNEKWWSMAKHIDAKSQRQMSELNDEFQTCFPEHKSNTFRGMMFKARWAGFRWMYQFLASFPDDFHPFTPGLEMKLAIEEAQKLNAHVDFAGMAVTEGSLESLISETRMSPLGMWYRWLITNKRITSWRSEMIDNLGMISVHGGQGYSEILDSHRVSWWVNWMKKVAPLQKDILVDRVDEKLFKKLYSDMPGKTIVAVVNQWHMPGIEAHWRHTTGTEIQAEPINPIGDMPIDAIQEGKLENELMGAMAAKKRNSELSGSYDYILHYHLVAQEYERERHSMFDSWKDPALEHSVRAGENDGVEYLPYEKPHH